MLLWYVQFATGSADWKGPGGLADAISEHAQVSHVGLVGFAPEGGCCVSTLTCSDWANVYVSIEVVLQMLSRQDLLPKTT